MLIRLKISASETKVRKHLYVPGQRHLIQVLLRGLCCYKLNMLLLQQPKVLGKMFMSRNKQRSLFQAKNYLTPILEVIHSRPWHNLNKRQKYFRNQKLSVERLKPYLPKRSCYSQMLFTDIGDNFLSPSPQEQGLMQHKLPSNPLCRKYELNLLILLPRPCLQRLQSQT